MLFARSFQNAAPVASTMKLSFHRSSVNMVFYMWRDPVGLSIIADGGVHVDASWFLVDEKDL